MSVCADCNLEQETAKFNEDNNLVLCDYCVRILDLLDELSE